MVISAAPVAGEVMFGWSPRRYVVATTVLGFAGAVSGVAFWQLVSLLTRGPGLVIASSAIFVTLYTISFALFSLLFTRARPPWLRFGDGWVEVAAEQRDVVVVPYAAVTSARVRRIWPIAVLDVVVGSADESQVTQLSRGGRRPLRKLKGDQLRFSIPLAGLSSSAEIRAELRRRGL